MKRGGAEKVLAVLKGGRAQNVLLDFTQYVEVLAILKGACPSFSPFKSYKVFNPLGPINHLMII